MVCSSLGGNHLEPETYTLIPFHGAEGMGSQPVEVPRKHAPYYKSPTVIKRTESRVKSEMGD